MPSALEDWYEILQLMYRERHIWDNLDAQSWGDVFTDDGYFYDGSGGDVIGRQALISFAQEVGHQYSGRFHMLANPIIVVEGDTAKSHSYFLTLEGLTPVVIGSFDDEVVRTPQGWRIARRVSTVFGPPGLPHASHAMAEGLLSPRVGLQHRGQLTLTFPPTT
jgi:hypothetical protein